VEDFSALASRIAVGVGEVRGCLILSRDGLVLGSYPLGDESLVKPAWIRFAAMGDPEKGFVEFADELWVYARRGPYAAFAVSGTGVRPGLLMEHLEQALLAAEEARAKRDALKVPEAPPAPSGKPRTSLHREAKAGPPAVPRAPVEVRPARAGAGGAEEEGPGAARPQGPAAVDLPDDAPGPGGPTDAAPPEEAEAATNVEEGEVDRVLLAQEFSRLLQESRLDDEA
jgi:hypothetical protein